MTFRRLFSLKLYGRNTSGTVVEWEYNTEADYDPANTDWEDARLRVSGIYRRGLFPEGRLRGDLVVDDAAVVLENVDGFLDNIVDSCFDQADAFIFERDPDTLATLYTYPFATLVSEQPIAEQDVVTVALHDIKHQLDRPYTNVTYAGTNSGSPLSGIEGTTDLKGRLKPMVIGTVFNMTPILVNIDRDIYQVTGVREDNISNKPGGIAGGFFTGWTLSVYDMRFALTQGADYVNQADMEANPPTPGQFRVLPSAGCFRVGSKPTGQLTCDVVNPAGVSVLPTKVDFVVQQLVKTVTGGQGAYYVPLTYFNTNPVCGIYLDGTSDTNGLSAVSQVLNSNNSGMVLGQPANFSTPTNERILWVQLTRPVDSVIVASGGTKLILTETDIEGLLNRMIPQEIHRGLPVWKVRLGYKKNYTVMGENDLSGNVSLLTASQCKTDYSYVEATDSTVKTQWPYATEMTVQTLLSDPTEAAAEASRLLTMFSTRRDMFKFIVPGYVFKAQSANPRRFVPGWVATITHSRFGLLAGKDFIILSMQQNLDTDMVEMIVWG